MRGHIRSVIDRSLAELWQPPTDHDDCPPNVFGEIHGGIRRFIREPKASYVRTDDGRVQNEAANLDDLVSMAMGDDAFAEGLLTRLSLEDFVTESDALSAISAVHEVLTDTGSDELAAHYLKLIRAFAQRYSLRYYIDTHAHFWISFSGLMGSYFEQIRANARTDPYVHKQLNAYEHMLAECLNDPIETRIMTAIQKQCNVLEAIGSRHHRVKGKTGKTMGYIVDQVDSWPHEKLREAAKLLYGFASDFPGVRHGGTEGSDMRELDLRDLVGVTLSLTGLVAYLMTDSEVQLELAITGEWSAPGLGEDVEAPWIDSVNSQGISK